MKYHEKALLTYLQAHPQGCSTAQWALDFGVKTRSVERWRTKLQEQGHILIERREGRCSYWQLQERDSASMALGSEELSALQQAIAQLSKRGFASLGALQSLACKVERRLSPQQRQRVQVDQEAMLEAEFYAWEPRLTQELDETLLSALRSAIVGLRKVQFRYPSRWDDSTYTVMLEPIGILHKFQSYLLGRTHKGQYRYYKIREITALQILDENFCCDPDFSLARYIEDSFGVFRGQRQNVRLRFCPGVSDNASAILFHPKQKAFWQEDGALEVRFSCRSSLELCRYLFSWGPNVDILAPKSLKKQYQILLQEALEMYEE